MTEISDTQTRIRVFIYTRIAEFGAPPTAERIADGMSLTVDDARAALEALAVNRQVILDPTSREIWMAGPFSAVPTRFRVHGAKASWWANCAWDMLGIPATLGLLPGRVTFVIDRDGIVRHVFNSQLQATKHVDEALSVLKRLS